MVQTNPFARRGVFKEHPKGKYIPQKKWMQFSSTCLAYLVPVVKTAFWTGMRAGEIYELKWSQVDLEQGTIDLSAEDTKTDEPRIIYLASLPELRKVFVEAKLRKKKV